MGTRWVYFPSVGEDISGRAKGSFEALLGAQRTSRDVSSAHKSELLQLPDAALYPGPGFKYFHL